MGLEPGGVDVWIGEPVNWRVLRLCCCEKVGLGRGGGLIDKSASFFRSTVKV